ncbi:hypothetical protein AVEN_219915-1 [Araneus ventricosus]|uniref:Uncharacterized protein n=1 Tax=Araneus ventricosus TaxID=182803 RepID=A0A4Y2SJJ2_ARAVE|nr:hypothetical protein AVEN_86249-1 [Araneus ventricosus]GBN86280.1 hypothetical protein AVEN_131451-1 [Araneus ventricosus]GBN88364.1 hypothetical protein AVEN_270039-1 [Araneus ventricosus]GBN88424.1 hypothetical protein AVEN_219915-1 [Araneus ventricosus]
MTRIESLRRRTAPLTLEKIRRRPMWEDNPRKMLPRVDKKKCRFSLLPKPFTRKISKKNGMDFITSRLPDLAAHNEHRSELFPLEFGKRKRIKISRHLKIF